MAFPQRLTVEDLEAIRAQHRRQENVLLLAVLVQRRRREAQQPQRRPRSCWVTPWVRMRPMQGQYYHIFEELDRRCGLDYKSYIRLDRNLFHEVLQRVAPRITKSDRYVQLFWGQCHIFFWGGGGIVHMYN